MPRFYFEVQTDTGVERDATGVDVADSMTALYDCLEVIAYAVSAPEFEHLRAVTIKADDEVVASINVEVIRRVSRRSGNGESSADDEQTQRD